MAISPLPDDPTAALATWRAARPAATLAEIEHEVDRQLSATRAELATASSSTARPVCPDCGTPLQQVGERARTVRTAQEGTVTFTGPAYRCPAWQAGLFPPG